MISSLPTLALKSLLARRGSAFLTMLSIAFSIVLLLGVDMIRVQARDNFAHTINGTDLIVGARSGTIQLLLSTVFHLGQTTNNVSWKSYQKISSHSSIKWSIPIALGDSHKGYRVIGTDERFFQHYQYGRKQSLTFQEGHAFHALFDVVVGAEVARKQDYQLGDAIILAHGMGNVSLATHKDRPFHISGILQPTGTPIDRSVLIALPALEAIHLGWQHGVANPHHHNDTQLNKADPALEPKNITAFLLGLKSKHAVFSLQRAVNGYKAEPLLAILPSMTLLELWKVVGAIENILLIIAALVVITSLLGMLAILLTTLNERRREIAVLRSVGASPRSIFTLLILESEFLLLIGIALGIGLLYCTLMAINPWLQQAYGIRVELSMLTPFQWTLLLLVMLGGLCAALIPAWTTYRKTLQDGLTQRH